MVDLLRAAAVADHAADILERAYATRVRVLEIEQTLAQLGAALTLASGVDIP